jgi:glycosyltransferase involved in cell wall biosynthesis
MPGIMQQQQNQVANSPSREAPLLAPSSEAMGAVWQPRVLMVGPHQTRTLGGISAVTNELLHALTKSEFAVYHIASQADEYQRGGKFLLALTALVRFTLMLFWWRPQLTYVHVGSNASLYRKAFFITVARVLGQSILTHFHAGDFDHYYDRQNRLGKWWIRCGLRQSHRLIAVSQASAQRLHALLPEAEITMIPNGIEIAAFAQPARSPDMCVRLLFVGAMGKLKGERDLLEAVQRIADRVPNLRLLLLGHGAETIEAFCRQHHLGSLIEHLGPVAYNQRHAFFRQADFFVLPSYGEGMPIAVLEAMAAGLPIIATRVGGIPELIEDGVEGFLLAPGDIAALSERIERLTTDPTLRAQMGTRSREKAQRFDHQVMVAQLTQEIRRLLKR